MNEQQYKSGQLESIKFDGNRNAYRKGLEEIKSLNYAIEDYIHEFPAFTGHLTLARFFSLYECYKLSLPIAGHIAEFGMYKGTVSLFFAKLMQIFEPNSLNLVHGFDWFKGGRPTEKEEKFIDEGCYAESYERVVRLIKAQNLDHIVKVHNVDCSSKEIEDIFEQFPHLYFKLVFLDIGVHDVLERVIPLIWSRMTKGGIMVLDHFSFELAPSEAPFIQKYLPDAVVHALPNSWMPTSYVVK